jgi:hypothetical protein
MGQVMSDPSGGGPRPDWRQLRRQEKRARRDERHEMNWGAGGSWVWGLILVALGVLFLLRNFGVPIPENWWAVFLILPGLGVLWAAWRMYQHEGRVTGSATGTAIVGAILIVFGVSFLAGFDWGVLWPVILIALGISVVGGGNRRR